jgi:hypothetical protein
MSTTSVLRAPLVALTLVSALLLATPPSQASSDVMGHTRAGKYYLRNACADNAAASRFYTRIWKGRKTITLREATRRLPELKHESRLYGRADHVFAKALYNPPAAWPTEVRRPVNHLASSVVESATILLKMGAVATARRWFGLNYKLNHVYSGHYAETIRAKLGLPPAGKGC